MSDLPETGAKTKAGSALREERNRQHLSIGDVSRHLKLSIRQVEALENDEFEPFGGAVFVHGFLRNYAKLLGLEVAPLILAADLTLKPDPQADSRSDIGAGQPKGSQKNVIPLFIVVAILISGVIAWMLMHDQQVLPGESAHTTSASDSSSATLGDDTARTDETAILEETAALTEPGAEMAIANVPAAEETATQTASNPAANVVRLVFDEESWLEVTDRYGAILVSEVVPASESRSVSGQAPLTVVIGNAAGVRLTYNNKAVDLAPHTRVDVARLTLE